MLYLANVPLGSVASITDIIFKKTLFQSSFGLVSLSDSEITTDQKHLLSVRLFLENH